MAALRDAECEDAAKIEGKSQIREIMGFSP
jgi:hypothetical protein